MVIIARPVVREFVNHFPFSAHALNDWYEKTKKGDWSNFQELKKTFNSADAIGNDRYVFDIGGNKYRLIGMIHFKKRTVYIRRILTHEEYTSMSRKGELKNL